MSEPSTVQIGNAITDTLNTTKIERIRDSLVGIAYHLPERETFLYPFVDNLLLLFQARVVVTLWNEKQGKLIFSSLRDPSVALKYGQPLKGRLHSKLLNSEYSVRIHHIETSGSKDKLVERDADYQALNDLLKRPKTSFGRLFFERLVESIESFAQNEPTRPINIPLQERFELRPEEVSKLLEPTRRVIDKIFRGLAKSPFFKPKESAHDLINLFAVVRVAASSRRRFNDHFDYTAGLLLTDKQRLEISRLFERNDVDLSTLETMLGKNDRSIADFIFSSGLVAFSGRVRSSLDLIDKDNEEARNRHAVEYKLYKTVILGLPHSQLTPNEDLFTFYIPIHVGGIPWIGLFTFTRQFPVVDDEAWNHNYHLYRDVLPRVASQIREGAKQAYTTLLADELTNQLTRFGLKAITAEELVLSVNAGWKRIAQVYPFDKVRLLSDIKDAGNGRTFELNILSTHKFAVEVEFEKTFLKRDVKFDLLRPADVEIACRRAVENYRTATQSLQIQSTAYATHILRTPLYRLKGLSMDLPETSEKRVIRYQIDKLLALESFANYLVNPHCRSDRAPAPTSASLGDLLSALRNIIDDTLLAYSNLAFAGNSAKVLEKITQTGNLEKRFWNDSAEQSSSGTIEYYQTPLEAALDGIISNALQYNHYENPSLAFEVQVSNGSVFLITRNPSTEDDLLERAVEMTQRMNTNDWIGLNIIYLACEACRFSDPVWTVEPPQTLVTKVQIGRVLDERR